MIDYLQSGPISRITVIPHALLHLFMEIDDLLVVQKKKLMEAIEAQKCVQVNQLQLYCVVSCCQFSSIQVKTGEK